jgi:hypothetical protein
VLGDVCPAIAGKFACTIMLYKFIVKSLSKEIAIEMRGIIFEMSVR